MGNPKQKWTTEEEEALKAGIAKYGPGKWKNIQRDPEFNPYLYSRSNIDLKDKWRNMQVNSGDKPRSSKPKSGVLSLPPPAPITFAVPVAAVAPNGQASGTAAASSNCDATVEESTRTSVDPINPSKYNGLIYEAISSLKDPNGVDINGIISYIEQKHQIPQNFRRQLSSRLRRLVSQDKLEKDQNYYRIKKSSNGTGKTIALAENNARASANSEVASVSDASKDAALFAAQIVADAENKSFLAAEAVQEAERVSKMAEDADVALQFMKEILQRCNPVCSF